MVTQVALSSIGRTKTFPLCRAQERATGGLKPRSGITVLHRFTTFIPGVCISGMVPTAVHTVVWTAAVQYNIGCLVEYLGYNIWSIGFDLGCVVLVQRMVALDLDVQQYHSNSWSSAHQGKGMCRLICCTRNKQELLEALLNVDSWHCWREDWFRLISWTLCQPCGRFLRLLENFGSNSCALLSLFVVSVPSAVQECVTLYGVLHYR